MSLASDYEWYSFDDFEDWESIDDLYPQDNPTDTGKEKRRLTLQADLLREMKKADNVADVLGDWREGARCAELVASGDMGINDWFALSTTETAAKASDICFNECPIRKECLRASTLAKEEFGLFGGLPENVRKGKVSTLELQSSAHDYERLVAMPSPYDTLDTRRRYHRSRLTVWDPEEDTV